MLSGDNGILKQVTTASTATGIAQIEEAAKLAYSNRIANKYLENGEDPTLADIIADLENDGYKDSIEKVSVSGETVTGVKLSQSEITVEKGDTGTITVNLVTETGEDGKLYFAKVNGSYYQINLKDGNITVDREATDISKMASGENPTINVSVEDKNIATAIINDKTITITGVGSDSTKSTTLTVEANGKTEKVKVTSMELSQTITNIYVAQATATELTIDGAFLLGTTSSAANTTTNSNYIWTTSNPDVATVTSDGIVIPGTKTSEEGGSATITCKGKNTSASITITSTAKIVYTNDTGTNRTIDGTTASATNPIIPTGYSALETKDASWSKTTTGVNNGLVIMDERGNQFVWIPVPNVIWDGTTATMPSTTATAVSSSTYTPMATTYTYSNSTVSGTLYRGMLYSFSGSGTTNSPTKVVYSSSYTPGTTNYREPSLVTYGSSDKYSPMPSITGTSYDGAYTTDDDSNKTYTYCMQAGYTDPISFGKAMQEDFNTMINQVDQYKGFYVGRYETSLDAKQNKVASVAGATSMYISSTTYNWYGQYKYLKEFSSDSDTSSTAVSSMIWGSQYDAMMNWMAKNNITVGISSNMENTAKNTSRVTGNPNYNDKLKNVYDIYGNSYEWTLEAYGTLLRAVRGGVYGSSGSPAYRSNSIPTSAGSISSARLSLYISNTES